MEWYKITDSGDIDQVVNDSFAQPVLVYKHSPICGLSSNALQKLEKGWNALEAKKLKPYFVDVVAQRPLSQGIAQRFKIMHQSPQVLLIRDGICVYDIAHFEISVKDLERAVG